MHSIRLLWDIDGTLVSHLPQRKSRHLLAVEAVLGRNLNPIQHVSGKTDFQIVSEILSSCGDITSETIEEVLGALDDLTERELLKSGISALAGVVPILEELERQGHINNILTGNTPRRARTKLELAGLAEFFDLRRGYFGDTSESRMDLVTKAVESLSPSGLRRTIVVGDSALDVTSAHNAGLKVIAVATGVTSVDQLKSLEPELILPNLHLSPKTFCELVEVFG